MINIYMIIMFISVSAASVSQLLLKKSSMKKHASIIKEYLNPLVICGYAILSLAMLMAIYAYSGMEYKNGPVIESFGNVATLALGYLFLKEKISIKKLAGIGCIIAGMAVFYM